MPSAMDLTIDTVTQPLAEWALDYGIPCALIRDRLAKGWSIERAVTEPTRNIHYRLTPADMKDERKSPKPKEKPCKAPRLSVGILKHNGRALTVEQWAQRLGVQQQLIYYRLRRGYPLSMVLDGQLRRSKAQLDTLH